ncbi:MAG: CHASE2 domain-containing protein [Muribaculaceae bacterium]|nr:CHASE2 domain-containing protein [Muribaculaceae bacterium]
MNPISARMSSLKPIVKASAITLLTLLFSHVAVYDLTSVSFFSPMEKASDFRFSDFYTLVANKRPVKELDGNIVIVALDGCDRAEMARAIDAIDYCGPAAVGLDIVFGPPLNPDDDPLSESMELCSNFVMPITIEEDSTGYFISNSYYDEIVSPSGGFAAINIQGEDGELTTIREFKSDFDVDGSIIKSLPNALAEIKNPEAAQKLALRGKDVEEINFASREFEILTPSEILDNQESIEGKVVLLGKIHDAADRHITPLDNYMPGILIHAYTLATILEGDYTRTLTPLEDWLIAALLCFLIVRINIKLIDMVMGPLLVRTLQIGLLYFLILTGTIVYVKYNIDLNFSYSILTVSLGVAACEVYGAIFNEKGLIDSIDKIFNKLKGKIRHEKKNIAGDNSNDISDTNDAKHLN